MNIFMVAADEPFPIGMACTNRMISLGKGFVEEKTYVKIICLRPTERPERGIVNKEARGFIDGIEFEYSCGTTVRKKNILQRQWLKINGVLRASSILKASKDPGDKNVLMLYADSLIYITLFFILSKIYKFTFIQDKSEYPFVSRKTSFFGKIYARLYTNYVYRLFDALLVMTKPLKTYFEQRVNKHARLLHVPMIVDISRFLSNPSPSPDKSRYIAYCGHLGGNKDGVPILIKSFAIVANKYSDVKLYIIGDAPGTDDLEKLMRLKDDLCLSERVVFTGRVKRDDIPGYLCNASILALARPTSLQSEGGFPSKLGEYLSTGNPVVVTKVGDIPDYLTDGENAFLVEPNNSQAFAEKLDYVIANQDVAKRVGINGRAVALKNFDYHVQAKRVVEFLHNMD